ncbi:MAG TPA: hypothetical protein VFZ70_10115 [Euzebyales bacterium]
MSLVAVRRPTRTVLSIALAAALVTGVLTPPAHGQAPDGACAAPVPIDEVSDGLTGTGLTVSDGTTPEPFDAEVLGVLVDGIAPGIDLIIADLSSPAVERAGIWAGMSGSPVYAADGRLIGAVSYSLAFEQSSIAGLTPAAQMTKLYDYPGATQSLSLNDNVQLPTALQQAAVEASDASSAEVGEGMAPLPVPLAVSGLRSSRLPELEKRLRSRVEIASFAASAAGAATADPSEIFPGSNFAAALSYGDVSAVGIGTTTDTCDGMALAFGHPFLWTGRTALSAHTADAIVIQPDGGFSYKIANPGGVVGTVDQDRLTGLRAALGDGPEPTVISSTVRSSTTGESRDGRTFVNRDDDVPDIAPFHLLANLDRILDKIGEGRASLTWTLEATDRQGEAFQLRRRNRFANRFDVSFESIFEMLDWLFVIEQLGGNVSYETIHMTSTVNESFDRLQFGAVAVKVNRSRWRDIGSISRLRPNPGALIRVRVGVKRQGSDAVHRTLYRRMRVPHRLSGQSMTLGVFGGASVQGETNIFAATTLNGALQRMRRTDSADELLVRLQRARGPEAPGPLVLAETERLLTNVLGGRRTVRVTVR